MNACPKSIRGSLCAAVPSPCTSRTPMRELFFERGGLPRLDELEDPGRIVTIVDLQASQKPARSSYPPVRCTAHNGLHGLALQGSWLGLVIDEQNKLSATRLQTLA